ncbi:MAG: hypothetical protein JJD92_00100 [Frankiaceae bacterium]|nr:hypothetical protein [Frankiaceae bacterium]
MPRRRVRRSVALTVAAVAVTAGCGTTVPLSQQAAQQAPGAAGLGAAAPGSSTLPAGATSGVSGPSVVALGPSDSGAAGATGVQAGAVPQGNVSATSPTGQVGARDTSPLKIGLTYVDNSGSSAALGATTTDVNAKQISQALVRGINAKRGLAGRKLEAIEYSFNTQNANYSQYAAEACAKFTQDNHVSVVLDGGFGTLGGFRDCMQKNGVLDITQSVEDDRIGSSRATLHDNTSFMTPDRAYSATLNGLSATGYLTKSSQFGIIIEECPHILRAYNNAIKPLIARLGMKAPLERTIECTTGFDSAGNAAAPISSAVLAFRQGNVDRVMFVSDFETVVLLLFANAASAQSYQPGYALTSSAQAEYIRQNVNDSRQWPQLNGVGWTPAFDVADSGAPPSATERRCLQLTQAGGIEPQSYLSKGLVYTACGTFLLLEAALLRTNGASAAQALQGAIIGLGSSFVSPGLIGGGTTFSSSRRDGPDQVRVFGYDDTCQCIRYRGGISRVPG